jgi:hypothetical protein
VNLAHGYPLPDGFNQPIELTDAERVLGIFCLGQPNCGKSSWLKHLMKQDCDDRRGFLLIDVEETLAPPVMSWLSQIRPPEEVLYLTPGYPLPFNILKGGDPHETVEHLLGAFARAWGAGFMDRAEDITRNSLHLLIEHNLPITAMPRLLSDEDWRDELAEASQSEATRLFFLEHVRQVGKRQWPFWIESVRNKAAKFCHHPAIKPLLESDSCVDLRALMDSGHVLVANLPERRLSDQAGLLGALIVSKVFQAALQRPEGSLLFTLYCDEFQRFASRSFSDLAVRGRKRGVGLCVAHQSLEQPPFDKDPALVKTVVNVSATLALFQMSRQDALIFGKEVLPPGGQSIKKARKKHPIFGGTEVTAFWSVQEEVEQMATELANQHPEECFIRIKGKGTRVYVATTYKAPEDGPDPAGFIQACLQAHATRPLEAPKRAGKPTRPPKRPSAPKRKKREEYGGDPV